MRTYQQVVQAVYGEARPSFWSGFGSVLNLFGAGKRSRCPRRRVRTEAEALAEDWAHVSRDLQRAFERAGCR